MDKAQETAGRESPKYRRDTARRDFKAACRRALQEGLTRSEALEVAVEELRRGA